MPRWEHCKTASNRYLPPSRRQSAPGPECNLCCPSVPASTLKRLVLLPANSIVVKNAPQIELLKRSALCITHAGLNTALESLTQGVPMVAIPVSIDQPGVAARIAYTKTGAYVPLRELSTLRLSTLIDDVLGNPKYRQNANELREVIVRTNGLEKAADLLEAFNLSPKPVTSSIS